MMYDKNDYYFIRKQKKIRLWEIAEYVGCSTATLSRFENDMCPVSKEKVSKYKQFIDDFETSTKSKLEFKRA